ncbi:MAG TPA: heme-binding protein [Alphaproteobacteria bacterium]
MTVKDMDLATANKIIETAMKIARREKHLPLTFCVVDRGGHMVSAQREDNSSTFRFEIAFGKAWTCIALGHSTHFVEKTMTKNRPHFVDSLAAASGGKFIPALGGVLIRDRETNMIVGAVGATGDSGENDEKVAIEAIEHCGFKADLS